MILPLKATDSEYIHIYIHTTPVSRSVGASPLLMERKRPSAINDKVATLHLRAAKYQKVRLSHSRSDFRQCSAKHQAATLLGHKLNIRLPSSAAEVRTVAPLCGIRHVL